MSQPQVSYRQQYVSGVLAIQIDQFPATSDVYVLNRSQAAGTAKVQFWCVPGPKLVAEIEDAAAPGSMFRAYAELQSQHNPLLGDYFWVEVWVTSPDLIPTCTFTAAPGGTAQQTQMLAYFAPGDFAQFTLPEHPGLPPGPPVPPPVAP
jgi:hypothetical protein